MVRKVWDRHEIKAEIHRRGASLSGIELEYGLKPGACRTAMTRRSRAGEAAIADFLGVAAEELWPERYAPAPRGSTKAARMRARDRQSAGEGRRA